MILDQHTGEKITATNYAKRLINGVINSGVIEDALQNEFNCDTDLTDSERAQIKTIADCIIARIVKSTRPTN